MAWLNKRVAAGIAVAIVRAAPAIAGAARGRMSLRRWAWPALAAALLLTGGMLAMTLFADFAADIREARLHAAHQAQLIREIVAGQLQDERPAELRRLLGRIGEADETIAAIDLAAADGSVIANYQKPHEQASSPAHSYTVDIPIAYSRHGAAQLHLAMDLDGMYATNRQLALQLVGIYAAAGALLALLNHIALARAGEAQQLRLADARLRDSNRTLRVLGNCNQALVRSRTEQELMDDLCRILIDEGGYALAWIGLPDNDGERLVRRAAASGNTAYLDGLAVSWARDEPGQEPAGIAIRTGRAIINRGTEAQENAGPWRAAAARLGLHSSIALPLGAAAPAMGALNIHAGAAGRFDEDEVRLLMELASDLSYGMQSLRNEARRRAAEETIEQQGKRFQALVECSGDGVALASANGTIEYAGPSITSVLGYRPGEVAGHSAFEFIHEDDRNRVQAALHACLNAPARPLPAHTRVRHKDGRWLSVEGTLSNLLDDPAVAAIVFNFRDVTHRLELELARNEANERFEQIAANVSEVFWVSDVNGVAGWELNYVSAAYEKIWQRPVADLAREPQQWLDAVHPNDRRRIRKAVAEKQVLGTYDEEYRIIRPDGTVRWIRDRAFPVRNRRGEIYRVVGTAEDITDGKNAHLQIQYLNRIYALLSGISSLIVRMRNRDDLFRETCRLAIESGQFRMAWIGMVNAAGGRVQPMAWSGDAREILDGEPLGTDPTSATEYGVVGQAIESRSMIVCNDVQGDSRLLLRDALQERGLRSLAVMPLIVGSRAIGALALYSGEPGFFNTAEERLLGELAGDIAFALEHIEKSEKIDYLAYYDQLTGLPNRALFNERVARRLESADVGAGHVGIVLLDVDRFRAVNDSLGRLAGDELIRQMAQRLTQFVGEAANLARTGANQFSLLVPGAGDSDDTADLLTRLFKACFDAPFQLNDEVELRIAVKAGIALAPGDGSNAEILQRNAEAALKKAKVSGEKYLFYAPHMNEKVAEKLSLESRLRAALRRDEFVLHYQPKIDLRTGALTGVEALIRWQSPDLGLVQPMQFIPILEETGLILDVGDWVIRRAAADYQEWLATGIAAPRVAVNVSAAQLRRADFVQSLRDALAPDPQAAGIDIELTESLLMENIDENVKKLDAARDMGIRIAIDDFGTGYSSLRYLAMLPANTLKIDRSFVITMLADPNILTLVSTIISMAHSLGLEVVAEGVDQPEQAQALRELGCDQLQGYLASRPVVKDALLGLLRTRPDGLYVLAPARGRLPINVQTSLGIKAPSQRHSLDRE